MQSLLSACFLAAGLAISRGAAAAETVAPAAGATGRCPSFEALERQGYRIGSIDVRQLPIFEEDTDARYRAIFRLADRLHVDTRDSVIKSQLLFRSGERVSQRSIVETERNLRDLRYIREPSVSAVACHDGKADLEVSVHEVWTTNPGISFGRSGGENSGGIKLEELNLLGRGKLLTLELSGDADRSSYTLHWRDPNVRGSRWLHDIALRDSNDGQGWSARFERPFYSLDSRWSAGLALQQDETIEPVYRLGERAAGYARQADFGEVRFGRSDGLREGWAAPLRRGYTSAMNGWCW